MWFLVILAISILIFINWMTKVETLWSLIVAAPVIYVALTVRYTILSHAEIGLKILIQTVLFSLLSVALDLATGFLHWSVNYVLPFTVIVGTLLIQILFVSKKVYWQDFTGYLLVLLLLCIVPLCLYFLRITTVFWPSSVSAFFSAATFVFMLFFFTKFKSEVKGRLYL